MKTRIFISCGQRKKTDEAELAQRIAKQLNDDFKGEFDPYVAVLEQSVRGLKENIFNQLKTSEYFLFVDFKREFVVDSWWKGILSSLRIMPRSYRGSLFTHQELAIASYLELETIAFHEEGIPETDGMRGVMQLNSEGFVDRRKLPEIISARVKERWAFGWKNELTIDLSPESGGGVPQHFYHLKVQNRHRTKIARDCCVFVEKVEDTRTKEVKTFETLPLKWSGSVLPTSTILAGGLRRFDAFEIHQQHAPRIFFVGYTDSGEFRPEIQTAGIHRVTYAVISSNFETVRITVEIDNTGAFNAAKIRVVD
jgi:hypothetical protein